MKLIFLRPYLHQPDEPGDSQKAGAGETLCNHLVVPSHTGAPPAFTSASFSLTDIVIFACLFVFSLNLIQRGMCSQVPIEPSTP